MSGSVMVSRSAWSAWRQRGFQAFEAGRVARPPVEEEARRAYLQGYVAARRERARKEGS